MVRGPDRLLGAHELMDLPDADPGELAHTLTDLAWINRWLGGMRLIRAQLPSLLDGTAASIRILDVGTGYADIPRAILRWGRRWGLPIEIEVSGPLNCWRWHIGRAGHGHEWLATPSSGWPSSVKSHETGKRVRWKA